MADEASPICRGKNLSWETVMLFYNYMPKEPMPKDKFNDYVEANINSWTQTHSQIARQLAFYYEEDGICYPRFTKSSTLADLFAYMVHWAHNYFIPNPYAPSLKDKKPTSIYAFLIEKIKEGITDYDEALDSMFGIALSSHDKVRVYLQNYTNISFDSGKISINGYLKDSVKINVPDESAATDAKKYFHYYDYVFSKPYSNNQNTSKDILSYLTAIRTKPFLLLAGISGTGKSRIVRKLAQATDTIDIFADDKARFSCHNPANFCLIQVKPNWHNSMDVVGFKSNLGQEEHYEFTPFVEFIAKAWHYPEVPFFLCLDEMNLAPVEEYFAEFLSAIESRSINENDEYETDPIIQPFDSFGMAVCGQMMGHLVNPDLDEGCKIENRFRKKGLTLPKNLIVMGTVNMDETTFSFSRKVLDRAMSIEMNEVDYDAFLEGKTENDIPVLIDRNADLVDRFIKAQDVKNDIESETVKDYFNAVNALLDGTPFKLGYRAANEAMLYVAAAKTFDNDNVMSALDDFTTMKILSRIEGDDTKLKTNSKDEDERIGDDLLARLEKLLQTWFADLPESKSIAKVGTMRDILRRDHFVSYWG